MPNPGNSYVAETRFATIPFAAVMRRIDSLTIPVSAGKLDDRRKGAVSHGRA
jgi:hypothetical protein